MSFVTPSIERAFFIFYRVATSIYCWKFLPAAVNSWEEVELSAVGANGPFVIQQIQLISAFGCDRIFTASPDL
ncbi:MAG TPA: hypothetical protein DC054_20910 [Blastocatellia bacterium]|nr:hypothetical protein [Blastocatellia bacterium]